MIEGQGSGKHSLVRLKMQEGIMVRKQAIGRSAKGRILESQGRVGGITPGRIGTCVLTG